MTTTELSTVEATEPPPPEPLLMDARHLSATGRHGAVFTDVTFIAPQNSLTVIVGAAGSGRTSLLLALAGRFTPLRGQLFVSGVDVHAHPNTVQENITVARALPGVAFDSHLRVYEALSAERAFSAPSIIADTFASMLSLLGVQAPSNSLLQELSAYDQLLLSVAFAAARAPHAVVVDDVDAGLTPSQCDRAWEGLRALADAGVSVIATATRTAYCADTVIQL